MSLEDEIHTVDCHWSYDPSLCMRSLVDISLSLSDA